MQTQLCQLVGWLSLFNAELSQKRYWRGSRSQEVRAMEEGGGERGRLYLPLHCHHQNNSCIEMGSDESLFYASLIVTVRDNVPRQCPETTTYEGRGQPKWNRTMVLLLTTRPGQARPAHSC